jgi:hypothetical protein
MNSYELSRKWFNYSFDNPEKVKPINTAIFFFAIEHCNRLGWKDKFGFPSQMVMEAIGVKNWRTYSKALNELVEWGFIDMIETSKNQYSSNIIAIVKNTKAPTKALDKALQKHDTKQGQSTVSIDKQLNNKQVTVPFEKRHIEFSKWFYSQLQEKGIISRKCNPTSKGWVNPIKLLEERDGIDWEQIKKGALFYLNKHDEKFMPVIQSPQAFREKWDNLRTFLIKQQTE